MRRLFACCAVAAAIASSAPAAATPDDPYGEDWVAIAVAPAIDQALWYGRSGTSEHATQIAMDGCNQISQGNPCYVASAIQYGCVVVSVNPQTRSWAGGRGPNEDSAMNDAAAKTAGGPDSDGYQLVGAKCSDPLTP